MAHFKRKRSRLSPGKGYSSSGGERRARKGYHGCARRLWVRNYPRHHDKLYHTRPHRQATRNLETRVLKGEDPEAMTWPLEHKPHEYYW